MLFLELFLQKVGQLSLSQRESEERQKQLDQERESHEQQLKELQEKHRERLESAQQKLREREKLARDELRDELRRRELFLREHRQFVKVCRVVSEHSSGRRSGDFNDGLYRSWQPGRRSMLNGRDQSQEMETPLPPPVLRYLLE